MSFLLFTKYNNVYPPLGCTHHTPYFIYTPIKLASFKNIINFALKNSNLALHGIYVLCKIKYPIASGGLCPPDPLLQRYNFRISPSPQKILDPPLISIYGCRYSEDKVPVMEGISQGRALGLLLLMIYATSSTPWIPDADDI